MSQSCWVPFGSSWACQGLGLFEFLIVMTLVFALCMILAGLFTTYFGSGKSRSIGVILLVVGLVVGFFSAYEYYVQSGHHLLTLVWDAVLILLASIIGAVIAVGLFLLAIMKS